MWNDFLNALFKDTFSFVVFGLEHYIILFLCTAFGIWFIWSGRKKWDTRQRRKYALWLCGLMMALQGVKPFIRLTLGNFNIADDLPLHLCNLMPFVMFASFYYNNRQIWALFVFWIVVGTAQSLFTPTLTEVVPHYDAIRYWVVHAGLVIVTLFGFLAHGWKLKFSDVWLSSLAMNLTALVIYPINVLLNSNYFYLNGKPNVASFYDLLPEWPMYIFHLEWIMFLLFAIVFFIFNALEKFTPSNR